MSSKQKVDPRAKRSRKWLQTALMELIEEKGYHKTTITNITSRAELSRPTFYLHYKSKEDILLDMIANIYDPIIEEFYERKDSGEINMLGVLTMAKLFKNIQDQLDVFRTLLHAGAERLLLERMRHRSRVYLEDLARRCEMEIEPEVLELSSWSMAGSFLGMLISWIENENPPSTENIGEFFSEATRPLLRAAVCNGELDYIFMR